MDNPNTVEAGIGITNVKESFFNMFGARTIFDAIIQSKVKFPKIASIGAGAGHFERQLADLLTDNAIHPDLTLVDNSLKMCELLNQRFEGTEEKYSHEVINMDLLEWVRNDRELNYLIFRNVTHFLDIDNFKYLLGRLRKIVNNESLTFILTASSFNNISLKNDELKKDGVLIEKKSKGGTNIPNGTIMTFVSPEGVEIFFEENTGMKVYKIDKFKYTNQSIANKLGPDFPDSIGIFLKPS